jgi:hypothetical protein
MGDSVSAQDAGFRPLSQQSLGVLVSLGHLDYEGTALNEASSRSRLRKQRLPDAAQLAGPGRSVAHL